MRQKLRVLIVDHAPIFGGVEAMITDLISAVNGERIALTVATDTASRVGFPGGRVLRTPLPSVRRNWGALITAGIRLAPIARSADVMMTFTARTHAIGAVAARLSGAPLIWRLADDTFPLPLARALAAIPRRIVAVSTFIAGRCSPSPAKTLIIPDGVPDKAPGVPDSSPAFANTRTDVRRQLGLAEGEVAAVMVARLVRMKGHAIFIRAAKAAGVKGLIVGGEDDSPGELGGQGLRQELDAIGGPVQFLGHRSDVNAILAASDIFVSASTRCEAFGRAIVEAMLAGLPVVATRVGGVPEVVGEASRLVTPGSVEALAAALEMDAATRKRLGAEGRERALARFELGRIVQQMEAVWQEIGQDNAAGL